MTHNLGTVVSFEFIRTIKKKSFWIGTLAVPIVMAIVSGLLIFSSSASSVSAAEQKSADISFTYTDNSGLIDPDTAAQMGGAAAANPAAAVAKVRAGDLDAHFTYPADPSNESVEVFGTDRGVFDNGTYTAVAGQLLDVSVDAEIGSTRLSNLAAGTSLFDTTMFTAEGTVSAGIGAVIPPLVFLVVFYFLIVFLGNQMLHSTVDEKENRITEMLLTTFNPTTLIAGKILALFMVGAVQLAVLAAPSIPAFAGYLIFKDSVDWGALGLPDLAADPATMLTGALLLAGGFLLFTGAIVATGAIMPTAKEAGGLYSVMILLVFVPLYAAPLILSDPDSVAVKLFTYFPFSAPVTAMIRNSTGSLPGWEAAIVIVELFVAGALVLLGAVHAFRYGSINYGSRLRLRSILPSRTASK